MVMEEVGAPVAPPIFIHQALPGRFCESPSMAKKRDLPWKTPNFHQQQQQQRFNSGFQLPKGDWNPRVWDWDCVKFVGKPSESQVPVGVVQSEQKRKEEGSVIKPSVMKTSSLDEDGGNLALKLGGSLYAVDEAATRPNKRVRSGSPGGGGSGSGGSYPMCQVDDCRSNLSNAKDYHRRHKVCELHSKTTKALVGKQMQRFCQQCSRFHPLSEFDEGKRSCRRRLAGHNRRRRKTQPEDVSSQLLLPGNRENTGSGKLDVVDLLTILAHLQGNNVDKGTNGPSVPDRDRLIQILSKINSLPVSANSAARLPVAGSFDLNVSQQASSIHQNQMNGNTSAPSTMDFLAVVSAAVSTSSPDALAFLSQRSTQSRDDDKTKLNHLDRNAGFNLQKKPVPVFPSVGGERRSTSYQSPVEVSDFHIQEAHPSLPLQLFSSSTEDDSPQKLATARKYFSSDSSSPMEERSPSSSPPIVHKLFPLQTSSKNMKHERMSISGEDNAIIEASTTRGWSSPLELFKEPNGKTENFSVQNVPYQAGYTSSSGSDHSPASSNSDAQDRTGRIIFKLFDKDPSNFPGTLRTQIFNWLSHSPSEMESYIRPGCVVLSVYVSMPSTAWEQLQEDLLRRVNSLVQDSDSDFWRNGRFLVHTDRQLALHKDGKIRLCKSWTTWNAPELISVTPLAVVSGQETSLLLKGRNLTAPGTKVHCTFMGGYTSKDVSGSAYHGIVYDTSLKCFQFPGGASSVVGRCFIEVENGFKGNSFPIIIADATVCQELRLLESEFEEDARVEDVISKDQIQNLGRSRSMEDVLHFLNELGWLFQRKMSPSRHEGRDFSHTRFKFLFTFSIERDWCAVVKTLLDIFVERNSGKHLLFKESLELLSEIHLLNRAVKRKCRNMVDLLIHYSVTISGNASTNYLFPPNLAGPGGVTPLHLAACMSDSEDMVDALTSDPQEIGLHCWNSLLDANGQSPYAYALMRNSHSYNKLVAQKLADRTNGQVSIPVADDISLDQSWIIAEQADRPIPQPMQGRQSCAKCAVVATKYYRRMPGAQGLLHRPYVHSMLAIAAVCVCVCLFLRGSPDIGSVAPFKWENLHFGSS
ncbi:hypothetical protein HHK36_010523 [Tetracentron sinense]|uniref:SBP-type domain-containing protein n=1 Tax=Tetracentron sinense TaxID=13715 RepID=A0A835DJB4_TETSI|nr:hypothetical protein HHK36_010523 [Tetracentron sinense]